MTYFSVIFDRIIYGIYTYYYTKLLQKKGLAYGDILYFRARKNYAIKIIFKNIRNDIFYVNII